MTSLRDPPAAIPFEPTSPPDPSIPDPEIRQLSGKWTTVLTSKCNFGPSIFLDVMQNLLKNPNITSSHLFRADIFYDSDSDSATFLRTVGEGPGDKSRNGDLATNKDHVSGDLAGLSLSASPNRSTILSQVKEEYRPITYNVPGYSWRRTVVRSLVPRNRQLDRDMLQTCHFYHRDAYSGAETQGQPKASQDAAVEMTIYAPHVQSPSEIPWYHPSVKSLAFTHTSTSPPKISIHIESFPSSETASTPEPRLYRTCLNILSTIHRHGKGQKAGYEKRVHHDLVVPQQEFQDTYARLKQVYARELITSWVESTDLTKHVFEDLGIAAFLIELWKAMYDMSADDMGKEAGGDKREDTVSRPPFPGFVDIGCGNGVLVNILLREGYRGWGFDARRRKTWATFKPEVQAQLQEAVLVPSILVSGSSEAASDPATESADRTVDTAPDLPVAHHNGIFPVGTFIISNHADELTPWTPLLGYINKSHWIAIPCCSHDLTGARFRAPERTRQQQEAHLASVKAARREKTAASGTASPSPASLSQPSTPSDTAAPDRANEYVDTETRIRASQAAETGTLHKSAHPMAGSKQKAQGKPPSAYSTLCEYVTAIASEIGFSDLRREMLRIPSTRNACIVGQWKADPRDEGREQRMDEVRALVCREVDMPIEQVGLIWTEKARALATNKKGGH